MRQITERVALAMFFAGLWDSAAAMVTASVPIKLNITVMKAPTTADTPLGAKPPWVSSKWPRPLTSRSGTQPISTAAPREMKAMIATTLNMANQNSNSPYLDTLNRLVAARAMIDNRANSQASTMGIQVFSTCPAARASMGITSTQNHQYIQPMVKPAQGPMAWSA
ncbi:hypothetical protein D3C76_1165810 [compost metagenome]